LQVYYSMPSHRDIRIESASLRFIPVETRVPLKFGSETLTSVTCARASVTVANARGIEATGWGETPLSVQWVWPSSISYSERDEDLKDFTSRLCPKLSAISAYGHALGLGHEFLFNRLPKILADFNAGLRLGQEPMPWLAALVCASAFDVALHDAYGRINDVPIYLAYGSDYLNRDLSAFLQPAEGSAVSFVGKTPADYFDPSPKSLQPVWHLVGGLDPLTPADLAGDEPDDGYPVHLEDWIARDGLNCLKIKLRGNDADWDYDRLAAVGSIANRLEVDWLTTDFNCTVTDPAYVNDILDQLLVDEPLTYAKILYVEQPFPYDLEAHQIDVHSVSARKPLFMDESAHDWEHVRLGRELGWTGVALKTCKTQTGALLSLCWAKAHGMTLMVQDLTNPMLAQIPHVLLGAHAGTIMGVESNAMQFYPEASNPEAKIHPGLYQRRHGTLDLSTIGGPGFGYRLDEIERDLPPPVAEA
jgi:L-alanine-DL-glutamate epimerase-like enolase superfamily enzyme